MHDRTVLEQKIRERRQSLEEFADDVERFTREHGEPGTLSLRHLQRLVAGHGPKGQPLGKVRPSTARLLEHMLGVSIDELLSPPEETSDADASAAELRQMLHASNRVDSTVIGLFRDQLTAIRRLDRQLGAVVAYEEVRTKTAQVERLRTHSLPGRVRRELAVLLAELHTLAGWQALDLGNLTDSWQHYEHAKKAARGSGNASYGAHAAAEQTFVLLDIGETASAVDMLAEIRDEAGRRCSAVLRAWLAAAHGEALAADNQRDSSLRAFDAAAELLPHEPTTQDGPYVVLDSGHLTRWRGHALARFAEPEAVDTLNRALDGLDLTFTRAETGLRVDLATTLAAMDEHPAAQEQIDAATVLATDIGSARQQRRLQRLSTTG